MDLFLKPEIALKRAHELINLGQKQDALQTLHDVITSKRYRSWQKIHETIMSKYVELCVDLRKGQFAKDGLIQYRFICQQVNVSSMEEVVKHFIHLSTEKAEKACSQAQEMEQALDVDDLEADKRPEDLLMCYVSGEKGKDRSDRELVTPWFKFLWETYRIVLEILRNHSKFEALYAMTAHRALQFCKQYKRKTEFRRLCEILRNHLANLNKHPDQRNRPDLSAPESLQLYLDTRFEQMKIATELELWQEAFRSVEDIHGLMCMVKKTPKPSLMTVYYVKLIEIFWISSSHLYHAYAWFKLFLLQKSFNKNLSQKDLELLASSVVLAALSAPPHDRNLELAHQKERNLRMANLIGFNLENKMNSREVLSRSSLLAELASKGVMSCVAQEVKDIYYLLEHKFLPSDLALKVLPLLNKISKLGGKFSFASSVPEVQLSQYVPALKKLATLRLLQQVSNVYQAMKVENLAKMMPFSDFSIVEKISVDAIKQKFISMKVDHMKKVVIFCKKSLEADDLWDHLASSAEPLNEAREMICPPDRKQSKLGPLLPSLLEVVAKDHKILLARKSIIEKRKEEQEQKLLLLEMEREEESNRLRLQEINEDTEQSQPATVHEQVNNQRILREIAEREHEEAERRRNEELAFTEQRRKRQEMEKKLKKLGKTMDFLERAKREEAAPLIEAAYQQRLVEERILHALEQQREVELSKQRHAGDLNEKERLSRMVGNKEKYQEKVVNHRRAELEERIMLQSRKQEREKMRKYKYYLQLEEERQLESGTAAPATSSAPTPGKYIPRFRRGGA